MNEHCEICDRAEGSTRDRCGEEDGVPLGPVEACPTCGRLACPDCMHEADCCFVEADDHRGDSDWAPIGWARVGALGPGRVLVEFQRTGLPLAPAAGGEAPGGRERGNNGGESP